MRPKHLPLSMVTLVFGALSIPLAFARQLVVPATIMAVLAIAFHHWGRFRGRKNTYDPASTERSRMGYLLALVGALAGMVLWVLRANNLFLAP